MTRAAACSALFALALAACGAGEKPAQRVGPPGALALSFEDDVGETFGLERLEVSLDGRAMLACGGEGARLDARSPVALWRGSAGPGEHVITIRLVYRGKGAGIFSYLQGYTFDVKSHHDVDLPPAGDLRVHAIAHEYGGPTTPLEERPQVRFEEGGDDFPDTPFGCPTGSRKP